MMSQIGCSRFLHQPNNNRHLLTRFCPLLGRKLAILFARQVLQHFFLTHNSFALTLTSKETSSFGALLNVSNQASWIERKFNIYCPDGKRSIWRKWPSIDFDCVPWVKQRKRAVGQTRVQNLSEMPKTANVTLSLNFLIFRAGLILTLSLSLFRSPPDTANSF